MCQVSCPERGKPGMKTQGSGMPTKLHLSERDPVERKAADEQTGSSLEAVK